MTDPRSKLPPPPNSGEGFALSATALVSDPSAQQANDPASLEALQESSREQQAPSRRTKHRPSENRDARALNSGSPAERSYFEDEELHSICSRATSYLNAGIPLRFHGPAGMGKTATALRVAHARGRPVAFINGHDSLKSQDLIGQENGSQATRIEDKYVASVRKTETRIQKYWSDGALLSSMTKGHTLVYDEFTRAPPEANVPLLSVIEEGVMVVIHPSEGRKVIQAHPEFRVILTSNPTDYCGTNAAPDALLDRVVTFNFDRLSASTRCGIIQSATGISIEDASTIERLLSALRADCTPTAENSLRTGILIAKIASHHRLSANMEDPRFIQVAADVLRTRLVRTDTEAAVREAGIVISDTNAQRSMSNSPNSQSGIA